MIHNIADEVNDIKDQVFVDKENKICFINNEAIYTTEFRKNFDTKLYETIIRSYEDADFVDQERSFVILRDFLNLVCSRYKLYHKMLGYTKDYCAGIENLINLWKRHAGSNKKILYNKWISSKDYRDEIGELIGILNKKDRLDYVSRIGNGSSFGGVRLHSLDDYLKRYEKIKLPKNVSEAILEDKELIQMNKILFDIDLNKIQSI
jgi:hypothetical protein